MNRALAARLVDAIRRCQREIDAAEVIAREIEDVVERDRYRADIMKAAGHLYVEVVLPIAREHPELDPHAKPA